MIAELNPGAPLLAKGKQPSCIYKKRYVLPYLRVLPVEGSTLVPDRDIALVSIDRLDHCWTTPTPLVLALGLEPDVDLVSPGVLLCLYGEARFAFGSAIHNLLGCSLHNFNGRDLPYPCIIATLHLDVAWAVHLSQMPALYRWQHRWLPTQD